jgi:hypothetical protein
MQTLKRLSAILALVLAAVSAQAQTQLLYEGFESTPYVLSTSGNANWAASGVLKATGSYSDSTKLVNNGDSAVLTSQSFSTIGMTNVALRFKQICKIEFFDGAYIEASTNNGVSWTRLDASQYFGAGQFLSFNNQFKDGSYLDWMPLTNTAIPNNTWWKDEVFDISSLVAGFSQVKIRFILKDMNANGGAGTYGWLLDDIMITGGTSDLVPPQIFMSTGYPSGQVPGTGPFQITATITDANGIASAMVIYTTGSVTDTVIMTLLGNNLYSAYIPSQAYLSNVCYRVVASDNSSYHNQSVFPATGCVSFSNYKAPVSIQVGTSTLTTYYAPLYNSTTTSTDKYSQHMTIFTPSEIGIKGNIQALLWEKANTFGYTLSDAKLRIYLKHTTLSSVSSTAGSFASELSGATLVFEDTLYNLAASAGWQTFNFNKSNFPFNGVDNLMILVDWYRPGSTTGSNISWYYTSVTGKAITFYGAAPNPTASIGAGQRVNTRFLIDQVYVNHDASVASITSPTSTFISSTPVAVTVNLKNSGQLPLTKATINWSVNGVLQTPYFWTGNLQTDMIAQNLPLGMYQFSLGSSSIKAWSSMPNDSVDMLPSNDTASLTAFGCNQILNGTYTVGTPSSDFQTFPDLLTALKQCGVSGPCTFKIMPGTYTDRLVITDTIPGLSATNNIFFTSYNSNAASVILKPPAGSSSTNYVINLNGAKYITIDRITIITESTTAGNCITFSNGAKYNTISNSVLQMVYGENSGVVGITVAAGCNYNNIIGNSITNGYKSLTLSGTSTNKVFGSQIKNNILTDGSRYAAEVYYSDSTVVEGNRMYCSYSAPSSSRYGLYVYYSTYNQITRNRIHMHVTGYAYSIYYSYCNDLAGRQSLIANNFLLQTGTSTVYGNHAINYQYSSYTKICHNSMMVATGNSNAGTINFEGGSSNVTMLNNVVANMAGGLAINHYSSAGALLVVSNYNNFYSSGSTLVKWNSSTLVPVTGGIAALTTVTGKDSNSFLANPMFYSNTDLHSFSPVMNNAALPVADVTIDYDGQTRSLTTPDIGADEYNVTASDAGVSMIIAPGANLVQGNTETVKLLIRNYGSTPLTSCQVSYKVNNGTPVTYNWSGNLITGSTDTVTMPSLLVPPMSFTLKAYTQLTGDTITFNDTTSQVYYGTPLTDASVLAISAPTGGCNPGNETVTVTIKNYGQQSITSGLTASFQLTGSSAVVTEPVNQTIAAAGTLVFSFSTALNLSTMADTTFILKVWVNHTADPNQANDTLQSAISALALLPPPVVSNVTISYGQTATLTAVSSNPVEWYATPAGGTKLASGLQFTTPPLFDTTFYYVRANTNIPSGSFVIGQGTNESGQYEFPNPFAKATGGNKTQYLILASEMAAQGYSAGPISSVSFFSNAALGTVSGVEIAIGTTTQSQATTTFFTSPLTTIFSGTVNITAGWFTIPITTPYNWNGTTNIIIQSIVASGITLINPPLVYDSTINPMTVYYAGVNAASATIGTITLKRHNIRINTMGTAGCNSVMVPVKVTVPPLQRDVMIKVFNAPVSGCGIGSTPVVIQVMNHGYDTIFGGIQVRYRIDNGSFTTPETINATLLPYSTYIHTFSTPALLPSGPLKQNYILTAVSSMTGDMYPPNDTLKSDTITSWYTPSAIVANPVSIPYGTTASLTPVASDTLYWYQQALGGTAFFQGAPFITPMLYDTAVYWVESRYTSPLNTYQVGTGTSYNGATTYPTPYGSTQFGAKHQFLIRASELTALGMQKGYIQSIGFNVAAPGTGSLQNYSISMGHTTQATMGQIETNLTNVFSSSSYSVVQGINTHQLTVPFLWDGISNLIIETCFMNSANGTLSQVYFSSPGFTSSILATGAASFSCSTTSSTATYTNRPNIYLKVVSYGDCISPRVPQQVNVSGIPAIDAAVSSIQSPQTTSVSQTPVPVTVVLKNYGTAALTSAPIWYQVNNGTPAVYNWSGSLARLASATLNIGNVTFQGGIDTLKVWVAKTGDNTHTNDSMKSILSVCMQGVYSIGQGKRFATISQAVSTVTSAGVCGHTWFDIDPGIYGERLIIPAIPGSGPNATITFRSSTLDSTDVTIQELTTQNATYVINLVNASWINLKYLTINANGSSYGYPVSLEGNSNNIQISNNILNAGTSNTMGNAAGVLSMSAAIKYITIANNRIANGYSGVHMSGASGVGNQNKILITGNYITNYYQVGIYAYYQDSLEISRNTIISGSTSQYYYGVRSYYLANTFKIHANKIVLAATTYGTGIDINYSNGSASNYGMIYNNMITAKIGVGNHVGLYSVSNTYVRFAFNSVFLSGTSNSKRAVQVGAGSNNEFINNNLVCEDQGFAFYTTVPGTISLMDRNNYYVGQPTSTFVYWGGNINSLAALKAYDPAKNAYSVSVDPVYKSQDDLHADNILINGKAIPLNGITEDIDGQIRNSATPDIGADEFFPAPYDLSVMSFIKPFETSCGYTAADSIIVRLRNAGENDFDFAVHPTSVKVIISGYTTDTLLVTVNSGILLSAETRDVTVASTYNLSGNGHYIMKAIVNAAIDTVPANNQCPNLEFNSLPQISVFPKIEDFESGYDLTFHEYNGADANISTGIHAALNSQGGLHFEGGGYMNWTTPTTVDAAFNNSTHVSTATSCEINPGSASQLKLKMDVKQTFYATAVPSTSWFRVMLLNANGSFYLKNVQGDSVFQAITPNQDPFSTYVFDLQNYLTAPFQISLQAVCRIRYGDGNYSGDNVFVDNIMLWEPNQHDAALQALLSPVLSYGKSGQLQNVKVGITNLGTSTITSLPVNYQYAGGSVVNEVFSVNIPAFQSDTVTFTTPFLVTSGLQSLCVFTSLPGDQNLHNDSLCTQYKGINTFIVPYSDDFEGVQEWVSEGTYKQWITGTPTKSLINLAHGGANAWATNLSQNYKPTSVEILYSPYFIIPQVSDTATLNFWQWMAVVADQAYGIIQYTTNLGNSWNNLGYIGSVDGTNWYNANITGTHCWSTTNAGWLNSSHILYPSVFNIGQPIQFRFIFYANSYQMQSDGWAIDDFSITIPPPQHDASTFTINAPGNSTPAGDQIQVKARFVNKGVQTITSLPISYQAGGNPAVTETWSGTLATGDTLDYTFATAYTAPVNDYNLCIWTSLAGDVYYFNDTVCRFILSTPGKRDAGIQSITAPTGQVTIGGTIEVKVVLKNFGTDTLFTVPVEYRVNNLPLGNETFTGTILPGSTAPFTFASTYISPIGQTNVCVRTALSNDVFSGNDEKCELVVATGLEDLQGNNLKVGQNIPNPATDQTIIPLYAAHGGDVYLEVRDLTGKIVCKKSDKVAEGYNEILIITSGLSTGLYLYSVEMNGQTITRKMAVTR